MGSSWKDDVRKDYEDMRDRFRGQSTEGFEKGDWLAELVAWILADYAKTVDADYLRRTYPGAAPANQAKKAITLASRHAGVAGAAAAGVITGLQVSSLGPQAMVTVPAAGAALMGEIGYTTRLQLRSTYDLSVIHGAPLSTDDVEDCYLILLTAMGVKLHELMGGVGKVIGPDIVSYNVRKLLRSGLRKGLQEVLKKVGGTKLARKLTERAMMRYLVPGVSIGVAYGFNQFFTTRVLNVANAEMRRRGAVVQPLVRAFKRDATLTKTGPVKALISVVDAGDPEGWSENQMDALRHVQGAVSLADDDLAELESYFDREADVVAKELEGIKPEAADELVTLCAVGAALAGDARNDDDYVEALAALSRLGTPLKRKKARKAIEKWRKKLR